MFRIADAEENLGESEVREAHLAKSLFFIRIGDKVEFYNSLFLEESLSLHVHSNGIYFISKLFPYEPRKVPWNN